MNKKNNLSPCKLLFSLDELGNQGLLTACSCWCNDLPFNGNDGFFGSMLGFSAKAGFLATDGFGFLETGGGLK